MVRNCVICGNGYEDPTGIAYCGILGRTANYSTNYLIIGCTITNTRGHGIDIGGDTPNTFAYSGINIISNDLSWNQAGFYPTFITNYYCGWNTFNYISYAPFNFTADNGGVEIEGCDYGVIEHNQIGWCRGVGINLFGSATTDYCDHNIVRYNFVHDSNDPNDSSSGYGIVINPWLGPYCNSNQFSYNVISNCTGTALLANNGTSLSNLVYNNVFYHNRNGIDTHAVTSPGLFITNNVFLENTNLQISANGTTTGLFTGHNSYYVAAGGTLVQYGANLNYAAATLANFEASCLTNNPALSAGFYPSSLSPCINAGVNVGLTLDYLGNPLIWGLPDIGACEYQLIAPSNMVAWVPGVTVGLNVPWPTRTNLIDVTQAPYNADSTGASDASTAVNAAIAAANSNDVVYFPANGRFVFSNVVHFTKSYISLRAGTNTLLIGQASNLGNSLFKVGPDQQNFTYYTIVGGSTRGSTRIVLSAPPTSFGVGDQIAVSDSDFGASSEDFPRISVFSYDNNLYQQCLVTGTNGNVVTLSAPLMRDFTNHPTAFDYGEFSTKQVGLENLFITATNTVNGGLGLYGFMVQISMCENCWMTNCTVEYGANYFVYQTSCTHLYTAHNQLSFATSGGSDHAGFLWDAIGESLFEDNIISDGIQPGIEFNKGFCANAIFANMTTNLPWDIDCHNTFPAYDLWEANNFQNSFVMDGYFGAAGIQTLFRNVISGLDRPIICNRWCPYMQIVGNVLGSPNSAYTNFTHDSNSVGYSIIELGRPALLTTAYVGTNPPVPYNFPGLSIGSFTTNEVPNYTNINGSFNVVNGAFVLTNAYTSATTLTGWFANIPAPNGGNGAIIFQDPGNTNLYYPTNGVRCVQVTAGTVTNISITQPITLPTGCRVFYSWQNPNCYQQLQTLNRRTYTVAMNYDYFHNAVTSTNVDTGTNFVQTIPTSLLYTNGAPSWWGLGRWPAIDPSATNMVTLIPAVQRYLGKSSGPATDYWVSAVTNSQGTYTRFGSGTQVDPYYGDFDYILTCLSNCTIHLLSGTHYTKGFEYEPDDLYLNHGVWVQGAGTNLTTIKRDFTFNNDDQQHVMLFSMENNVTLSDLTLDCAGTDSLQKMNNGVLLMGSACLVSNIVVTRPSGNSTNLQESIAISLGTGTFSGNSSNDLVVYCTVTNVQGTYEGGINLAGYGMQAISNTIYMPDDSTNPGTFYIAGVFGTTGGKYLANYGHGGNLGGWSDTGCETNLSFIENTFAHGNWGIKFGKSGVYGGFVDGLFISNNIIQLSTLNGAGYGVQLNAVPGPTFGHMNIVSNSILYEAGTPTPGGWGIVVQVGSSCDTNIVNLIIATNVIDSALSNPLGIAKQGYKLADNVDQFGTPLNSPTILSWQCPQSVVVFSFGGRPILKNGP